MARQTSPAQMETPIPRLAKASTISDDSKTGEKPERLGASGVLGALGRGPFIVYKNTQKELKGYKSHHRRQLHSRPCPPPTDPTQCRSRWFAHAHSLWGVGETPAHHPTNRAPWEVRVIDLAAPRGQA